MTLAEYICQKSSTCEIDLIIELIGNESNNSDYDLLGIEDIRYELLGERIPHLKLQVRKMRDLSTLIVVRFFGG